METTKVAIGKSVMRDIAKRIVRPVMRRYHGIPGQVVSTLKDDLTPVTEADRIIDQEVTNLVLEHDPEYGIVREEGNNINEGARKRTIIDGIDGTGKYSRGGHDVAFAMAVQDGQFLTHSLIYNPLVQPELWFEATLGMGAFLNDKGIHVSPVHDSGKHPIVEIATAPGNADRVPVQKMFLIAQELQERGFMVNVVQSISYSNAMVAAGLTVGTIFPWRTLWDIAPGDLLVREAGGRTSDLRGNDLGYRGEPPLGAIMSNGHFHNLLVDVVAKYY